MSIVHLAAYDEKGQIMLAVSGPPNSVEATLNLNSDLPYLVLPDPVFPDTQFVQDEKILPRPAGAAVLEGDQLSGVPSGASVLIEGVVYQANGETITLSFSLPGTYKITIKAWPAMDQEVVYENRTQV
jgi:hypothetical protein